MFEIFNTIIKSLVGYFFYLSKVLQINILVNLIYKHNKMVQYLYLESDNQRSVYNEAVVLY